MKSKPRTRIIKHAILFSLVFVLFLTAGIISAQSSDAAPYQQDLSQDQINRIKSIIDEFYNRELEIIYQMEHKALALYHELQREDAFADEAKAAEASKTFKVLVKDISNLMAQLLRSRTEYFLKIKHVLNPEQKKQLLNSLNVDLETREDINIYYEVDIEEILGGFTPEQGKKIVKLQHDVEVKIAKIKEELNLIEIDFREELSKSEPNSGKIRKIIQDVTELNIQLLEAVVDATLKFKDVLTIEQKKKMRHFILTAARPDFN